MADNSSSARQIAMDPVFGNPFEFGLENINPTRLTTSAAESIFSAVKEIGQEVKGLPPQGEVKGFQKPNEQLRLMEIKSWVANTSSAVQTEHKRGRQQLIMQEEIDMGIQGMSGEQKNRTLNYQLNYQDINNPYQVAQLRAAMIEQRKSAESARKAKSIQVPQSKPKIGVDLEAQNEGGRGRGGSVISSAVTAG